MSSLLFNFFFFNDTATTEIYTLSLHDALPIWHRSGHRHRRADHRGHPAALGRASPVHAVRSEEHTSELQSHHDLVCRLLLEKKKKEEEGKSPDDHDVRPESLQKDEGYDNMGHN